MSNAKVLSGFTANLASFDGCQTSHSDDPFFTLADDSRALHRARDRQGGSGPWYDFCPINIIKPVPFIEALIFFGCRDYKGGYG